MSAVRSSRHHRPAQVLAEPIYLTPDQLAARIGLTDAKRTELKLWSIGAVDCTKAQRIERRKKKKAGKRKANVQPFALFARRRSRRPSRGLPSA
jgi:hypothetical protein